jgi:hypothetical protein
VLAYEEASGEDHDEKESVLACEQTAGDAPRVERPRSAGEAQRSSKLVVLKYCKSQISGTKVLHISGPLVLAYEETVGSRQKTRTLPRSSALVWLLY